MTSNYSNDIAPYLYTSARSDYFPELHGTYGTDGKLIPSRLTNLDISNLKDPAYLGPLGKLAIADTFHDLAQARLHYNEKYFKDTIMEKLISDHFHDKNDPVYSYRQIVSLLFSDNVLVSSFEPTVNSYIESFFGLQPAIQEITFDNILFDTVDDLNEKVSKSNGSVKLVVPTGYTSFSHYLTKFKDRVTKTSNLEYSYLEAQGKFATFIKEYLHHPDRIVTGSANISDTIRFLFDAGANAIGKIFRYPGSGGVRYNAMACTADSASSSDDDLDPTIPNAYEQVKNVNVSSNFLSFDKHRIRFTVNDNCTFGEHGTSCFSVNFMKTEYVDDPLNFGTSARYFIGPQINQKVKDKLQTENKSLNPDIFTCGTEGASVSHIGKTFITLEKLKTGIKKGNYPTTSSQYDFLNSTKLDPKYTSRCLPVADGRFLKLVDGNLFQTEDQINDLEKLISDYKRTGDYEQALTLRRAIENESGNGNCYTYSSIDLLSALFARLNGIPSIFQVSNGTMSLYRSDAHKGTPEQRKQIEEDMASKKQQRIKEHLEMITENLYKTFGLKGEDPNENNADALFSILQDFRNIFFNNEIHVITYNEIKMIYVELREIFIMVNFNSIKDNTATIALSSYIAELSSYMEKIKSTEAPNESLEEIEKMKNNIRSVHLEIFYKFLPNWNTYGPYEVATDTKLLERLFDDPTELYEDKYSFLSKFFPTMILGTLKIKPLTNKTSFTLPFFNNMKVTERKTLLTTDYQRLEAQEIHCSNEIKKYEHTTDKRYVSKVLIHRERKEKVEQLIAGIQSKILFGKSIMSDEMFTHNPTAAINGGGTRRGKRKTIKKKKRSNKSRKSGGINKNRKPNKNKTRAVQSSKKSITNKLYRKNKPIKTTYRSMDESIERIISHEILDILNSIMNRCNKYLKDLYGLRGAIYVDRSNNDIEDTDIGQLEPYSDALSMFLSALLFEYIESLNILCSNYNINLTELFSFFKILTWFLCLLTVNGVVPEQISLYDVNEEVTSSIRIVQHNRISKKEDVDIISAIHMSILARVGYEMGNFNYQDYYYYAPNMKTHRILKELKNHMSYPAYDKIKIVLFQQFRAAYIHYESKQFITMVSKSAPAFFTRSHGLYGS